MTNGPFDLEAFLDEPLRPAQVASVSPSGAPLLGSLWFLFSQGRFWFSSRPHTPLPAAMARGHELAVIVDDFSPPEKIRQVRVRGPGRVEPHEPDKVKRIYERYLGSDISAWPDFFGARLTDPGWALWTVTPASGLAVAYPNFETTEVRWRSPEESPLPD